MHHHWHLRQHRSIKIVHGSRFLFWIQAAVKLAGVFQAIRVFQWPKTRISNELHVSNILRGRLVSDELENGAEILLREPVCLFWNKVPIETQTLNKTADLTESLVVDRKILPERVWGKELKPKHTVQTDVNLWNWDTERCGENGE